MELELNENKTPNRKRLIIDVPDDFHSEIKSRAAKKEMSMKSWVTKVLLKAIREEKINNGERE